MNSRLLKVQRWISALEADAPLSRQIRREIAEELKEESRSQFQLKRGKRGPGRPARQIKFDAQAYGAAEFAYSLNRLNAVPYKVAIFEASEKFAVSERRIKNYYGNKNINIPAKPLSMFDGTATEAEVEKYEAEWDAWRDSVDDSDW